MSSAQEAAFRAGSGMPADMLLFAIAGTIAVLATIWVSWVAIGAFRAWRVGDIEMYDLLWQVVRAAIVLLILGYYVR
ncbi:MAG: TIGR03758 family integrating conjugative element protein [Gammaproteobacteria bacterium]|nr:TIGR03758 family integrating conjugative element protein [Gammaproteobacteria bacterium]